MYISEARDIIKRWMAKKPVDKQRVSEAISKVQELGLRAKCPSCGKSLPKWEIEGRKHCYDCQCLKLFNLRTHD